MANRSNDIILGLDIGTKVIKAVLGRRTSEGWLELLASTEVIQQPEAMHRGIIANASSVIASCDKAISILEHSVNARIKNAVLSIGGENIKCTTSKIRFRRNHPNIPISELELSALLEKIRFETGKTAQKNIALELDNPYIEVSLIGSSITRVRLDGKDIDTPLGYKGSDLYLEFYTSFAPKPQLETLEKVCSSLDLNLLATSSTTFASCRAIMGDLSPRDVSTIIIDIGSECTDIAIIDDYGIRYASTFIMGSRTIKSDINIWLEGLILTLTDDIHLDTLPDSITIIGGASDNSSVEETLALSDWYRGLPFDKRPVVSVIDISGLQGIKNPHFVANKPSFTTAIGLLRIAIDTQVPDTPRTKVRRALSH